MKGCEKGDVKKYKLIEYGKRTAIKKIIKQNESINYKLQPQA